MRSPTVVWGVAPSSGVIDQSNARAHASCTSASLEAKCRYSPPWVSPALRVMSATPTPVSPRSRYRREAATRMPCRFSAACALETFMGASYCLQAYAKSGCAFMMMAAIIKARALSARRCSTPEPALRAAPNLADEVTDGIAVKVAGQVPDVAKGPEGGWDVDAIVSSKDQRKMDRFIPFALGAAQQALAQAGWPPADERARERTATVIASGIGGFGAIAEAVRTTDTRGPQRLSPFTVPSFLVNLAAGQVSIRHGLKGPLGAPVTACAASVQAMGEGAGMLVIEALDHALARGATPLAELVGYGTSADAYHITSGPEDGDGAARSMLAALAQAGLTAQDVQHLNAHATSTGVGDRGELAAIRRVFGGGSQVAISSSKSATGHLLGAAGAVAAIFTTLALRDQVVPGTLNLHTPVALAEGLDLVALRPRPMALSHAMLNGFGFGGVNATLVLRRWPAAARCLVP